MTKTIGILGAGQLGKMLAEAATKLGYHTHIYAPDSDPIAASVSTHYTKGDYTDLAALKKFAGSVDVITLEFENVPVAPLKTLSTPIHPSPALLETSQHRVREKKFAQSLGIGTAPFMRVSNQAQLIKAFRDFEATPKAPLIVKTSTMGYDGKGQVKIKEEPIEVMHESEIFNSTPQGEFRNELIAEGFVNFDKEISVIVARNEKGDVQCFEPVENVHKNHILHTTTAPANIAENTRAKAIAMATKLATHLELVGLLAVEMFVTKEGDVLMNEMAPRPHNSGHWTLDGCNVSQFEQAIRAVTGMDLVTPKRTAQKVVMTNLIGDDVNHLDQYPGQVHIYGKKEVREGRKMGHVTQLVDS